jgi:hypothetical protein
MTMQRATIAVVLFSVFTSVAFTAAVEAARSPICTRGITDVEVDPRGLLRLSDANPIGAASAAALRFVPRDRRPQVRAATFAVADRMRGPQAKFACGARVWRRTVVVYILERVALPAQSASQRVFFVGRFENGYRVWQVVH